MNFEKDLYHLLFETADKATLLIKDGAFIECNSKAAILLGSEQEKVKGHTILDFSPEMQPDGRQSSQIFQIREKAALNGQPQYFAWLLQSSEAEAVYTQVTLKMIEVERTPLLHLTLQEGAKDASVQARYQNSVAQVAGLLTEQGLEALDIALELLGYAARVSMVFYFKTIEEQGNLYWQQAAGWRSPKLPSPSDVEAKNKILISDTPFIATELRSQRKVAGLVKDMPDSEQKIWAKDHSLSIALLAVSGSQATPGFISFHETTYPRTWQEGELAALQTAAAVLTNTLARENLLNLMQNSLAETQKLYEISRKLSEADNWQEVVTAVAEGVLVPGIEQVQLFTVNYDRMGVLEGIALVASWHKNPNERLLSIGNQYTKTDFPDIATLLPKEPLFINNTASEINKHTILRVFWEEYSGPMVILPLQIGARHLGMLVLLGEAAYRFSQRAETSLEGVWAEDHKILLAAVAEQVLEKVENLRLFEDTKRRIAREQRTRQIVDRIRATRDIETAIKTALEELSTALGISRAVVELDVFAENTKQNEASKQQEAKLYE